MNKAIFFGTLTAVGLVAGVASADTLADVKARGELNCGVNTGLVGFAAPDANGNWSGFDVAICKAVAAAVLGDANKVKYVPPPGRPVSPRWPRARSTCWPATRPGPSCVTPT